MRLIDADAIDFSAIKDPFDQARAKIIIMGQPTVKPQNGSVNFSHRLIIAKNLKNGVMNAEWIKLLYQW